MPDVADLQVVAYEKRGPIATLRLNRPERLNTFGAQVPRLDYDWYLRNV